MKKLLCLFLLVFMFSCEKATCWECTTIKIFEKIWRNTDYSEKDYDTEKVVICDHTEKQIRAFEDKKTYTSDTIYLNKYYAYVTKSSCYCVSGL